MTASRGTLIAYGAPGLPLALLGLPLYVFLPAVYAIDLGLGLAAVGAVLLAVRVLDVASDPLLGWSSDRTRSRVGRVSHNRTVPSPDPDASRVPSGENATSWT